MEHQSESVLELVQDPLLREVEFPHVHTYFPYGIPLVLRTNSTAIVEAARQSWGHYKQAFDFEPVEMEAGVAGSAAGDPPPNPLYRARRNFLTITGDAEHFAISDFTAGFGICWVTPRILNDLGALRFFYLDALGYSLVAERYLAPVHGATVGWKGRGTLLCGHSQAGKSSLAYACARRGFTYVSDDGSFLLREARDRTVIGNPRSMRFRVSAIELFPELADCVVQRRPNGKVAIEVGTDHLNLPEIASQANVDYLIFLNRAAVKRPGLRTFSKSAALTQLEQSLLFGRDSSLLEQRESLKRLVSEVNVYELTYSDLEPAVDRLRNLLETGI